jgi:hypothetical protein
MLTSLKADKAAKLKSEIEAQWAKIIEACFD